MTKSPRLIHFRYLFYPFLALLFGIAISRKLFAGDILACVIVALLFFGLAILCIVFRKYKPLVILSVFFLLGCGGYFLGLKSYECKDYEGVSIVVGRVTDDIKENSYSTLYTLDSVLINGEGAKNINLRVYGDEKLKAGDKVTFSGEVEKIKLFELGSFNSTYLRGNIGYEASVNYSAITVVDNNLKFDESLRVSVKDMLYANMSAENAAIAYAVLFGDKYDIPYDTKDVYREAGIIHILTVSGLHVGFLVAILYFLLGLCHVKRLYTTIITGIILILYNIICGFAPSVLRASIMAMVIMLAKLSGREYDSLNSLGLAGFIILAINPLYAFDTGFLMSFFCVASIFMLNPVISKLLKRIMPNSVATYISLSISAQIGILPFIASFFQNLNLLSFFANLIIVPIFSILYPLLFIASLLFLIMPFLAKGLVVIDFAFTAITSIANFFASTSMLVPLHAFDITFVILLFILVFILSRFLITRKLVKFLCAGVLSLLFVASVVISAMPVNLGPSVMSLNAQGMNSLLISTSSGQTAFIYDDANANTLYKYFYVNKIQTIDYVILYEEPSSSEVDFWAEYNVKKFICYSGSPSNLVSVGSEFAYGSMQFKFTPDGSAVEINFDGNNIFVATNTEMSYNEIELLTHSYDLVYNYQNFYYLCNKGIQTHSMAKEGNLALWRKSSEWQVRGID